MPTTIRFLSWNVQKFGYPKLAYTNFPDYFAGAVKKCDADVVGIMEVVAWAGVDIVTSLKTALGADWEGCTSEVTALRPNEQYIFLWNKKAVTLSNLGLPGICTDDDLKEVFTALNIQSNPKRQGDFNQALVNDEYVDDDYVVNTVKASPLAKNPSAFTLTGWDTEFLKLSVAALLKVKVAIVKSMCDLGPSNFLGYRPPFLARFALAKQTQCATLALYHAPGPDDPARFDLINRISSLEWLYSGTDDKILMGDFNVTGSHFKSVACLEFFDKTTNKFVQFVSTTGQPLFPVVFQTLTGPDDPAYPSGYLKFRPQFPLNSTHAIATSLSGVNAVIPTTVPVTDTVLLATTSSSYDNFLYQKGTGTGGGSGVYQAIAQIVPKAQLDAKLHWLQDDKVADNATTAYNSRMIAKGKPQMAAKPANLPEGFKVYHEVISDHMPITFDVEWP